MYCEHHAALLEVWVCWGTEAATWRVFTELQVLPSVTHVLFRAVRAQGDALIRVLCRAFDDFYNGRPIIMDFELVHPSDKPTHNLYLSARLALRSALRRELQIRGFNQVVEALDRDAATAPTPARLAYSDRLWNRTRPPRFGPTSKVSSMAQCGVHEAARNIVDTSVERAFVATRYRDFADRVEQLIPPLGDAPILGAVQFLARRAAEEANTSVFSPGTETPNIWAIRDVRCTLEQLLKEFIAIG